MSIPYFIEKSEDSRHPLVLGASLPSKVQVEIFGNERMWLLWSSPSKSFCDGLLMLDVSEISASVLNYDRNLARRHLTNDSLPS